MKVATLARDPFSRCSLVRRKAPNGSCQWCGDRRRLWEYGREYDSGKTHWIGSFFCCIGCFRAYFY